MRGTSNRTPIQVPRAAPRSALDQRRRGGRRRSDGRFRPAVAWPPPTAPRAGRRAENGKTGSAWRPAGAPGKAIGEAVPVDADLAEDLDPRPARHPSAELHRHVRIAGHRGRPPACPPKRVIARRPRAGIGMRADWRSRNRPASSHRRPRSRRAACRRAPGFRLPTDTPGPRSHGRCARRNGAGRRPETATLADGRTAPLWWRISTAASATRLAGSRKFKPAHAPRLVAKDALRRGARGSTHAAGAAKA